MKTAAGFFIALLVSPVMAGTWELSSTQAQASKDYSQLLQQHIQLSADAAQGFNITSAIDRKKYTDSDDAMSAEVIVSKTWTPHFYTMTRAAVATNNDLFINNALYNEFGLKTWQNTNSGLDMALGVGTRQFPAGHERFMAFGPTISTPTMGLWLRREQSLDSGGNRNSASMLWYPEPNWSMGLNVLSEQRKKYLLPSESLAPQAKLSGQRYGIKIGYQYTQDYGVFLGLEKINQRRDDLDITTYAPIVVSIGITGML